MYLGLPLDCVASSICSPYRLFAEGDSGTELVGDFEGNTVPASHAEWNVEAIRIEDGKLVVVVNRDFDAPHTGAHVIRDDHKPGSVPDPDHRPRAAFLSGLFGRGNRAEPVI